MDIVYTAGYNPDQRLATNSTMARFFSAIGDWSLLPILDQFLWVLKIVDKPQIPHLTH